MFMKKFLFVLMAIAAAMTVSCNKPADKDDDQKEPEGPKYRIASLAYTDNWWSDETTLSVETAGWWDTWYFTYDDQGRVIDVDRREDSPKKHWTFAYSDGKVTITRADNLVVYNLVLNKDGVCTSIETDAKEGYDDWAPYKETAVFEYDETLRNTKITKDGELRSELTWRDNCLVSWTKAKDNNRLRTFTYANTPNKGDLHAIYSEAVDPPARWMYETGLFGHGPAYLPKTSVWEDDKENGSSIACAVDENGYCIAEVKTFPIDNGKTPTEIFKITWEEIK